MLGQWQRVLVAELDGPRARTLRVQIMGHCVDTGNRRKDKGQGARRSRSSRLQAEVGCNCEDAEMMSRTRVIAAGLSDIAEKLDAGERLTFDDGVRLFECPDLLARRLAREPRAREAARRAHLLQLQHPARGDQRLRRELPVLLVRAAEAGRSQARTRCRSSRRGTSCASAPHQPLTEIHVVNGLHPDLPFELLHGPAARLQAHPARASI